MAEIGIQKGKRMWPSLQTANVLFSASNILLIVGLSLTVVATIGAVWMANVREGYLKTELSSAQTAAAEANARALEAALELERFKAPRTLNSEQREAVASVLKEFAGQEFTAVLSSAGNDVRPLWGTLVEALTSVGWVRVEPAGLATGNPPAGVAIAPSPGISIVVRPEANPKTVAAAQALTNALKGAGLAVRAGLGADHKEKRPNIITIVIGLKPQ